MTRRVSRSPLARRDLVEHYVHIGLDSVAAADRFIEAVESTFATLAEFPNMGRAWSSRRPRLRGLRVSPVVGFHNVLIFYRPVPKGIEMVRVLHGARDLKRTLSER